MQAGAVGSAREDLEATWQAIPHGVRDRVAAAGIRVPRSVRINTASEALWMSLSDAIRSNDAKILARDGRAQCWGRGDAGQLGNGAAPEHSVFPPSADLPKLGASCP